jgi:hypothetical protein
MALSILTTISKFDQDNLLLIGAVRVAELYRYDKWRAGNNRRKNPEYWNKYSHLSNPSVYHNASVVDPTRFGMDRNASRNQNHYYAEK